MRLFLIFFAVIGATATCLAEQERPNVILILADDLGAGDLGCYNAQSKIPTPNLDALAKSGMRFTSAYCPVSVCSPSRYALMTGAYPWRSWKKRGVLGNWDKPMIEDGQTTLPGLLKDAGYLTAGFGKWHLGARFPTTDGMPPVGQGEFKAENSGGNIDLKQPISGGPLDRGFSQWKGMICSSEMLLFEDNRASAKLSHELYEPLKIAGLSELLEVKVSELLPRTTRESVAFLNERAAAKDGKPFFLYFAPYVPHIPLAVSEEFRGKTKAGEYGDYVHELDHHIGLLMKALKDAGLEKDTLVLFASDNGSQWPKTGDGHHPNGDLRGGKWSIYEGGVRTPLIATWPGKIKAESISDGIIALNDLLATMAAASGRPLPEGAGPDSLNQWPVMLGQNAGGPVREEIFTQASSPDAAYRKGNWKFVHLGGKKKATELYDLAADPQEKNDLSKQEPERLKEMAARFRELRDSQLKGR